MQRSDTGADSISMTTRPSFSRGFMMDRIALHEDSVPAPGVEAPESDVLVAR